MQIISSSINLSKIDKSKLVKDKNGNLWLNMDIFISDTADKYGNDVSLCYRQSKEERERKDKKVYIGNGKTVYGKLPSNQQKAIERDNETLNTSDDLPF